MTEAPTFNLQAVPAFKELSEAGNSAILKESKRLRYKLGQPVCNRRTLPNVVQLILEGEARLLGIEEGNTYTTAKLRAGNLVGLASLLRGEACEEISATEALSTLSIPDSLILSLYQSESSFRSWCNTNILPSEGQALADLLVDQSPRADVNRRAVFSYLMKTAELRCVADGHTPHIDEDKVLLVGSAHVNDQGIGHCLKSGLSIHHDSILPARLFSIPKPLYEQINQLPAAPEAAKETEVIHDDPWSDEDSVVEAPALPEVGGLRLRQEKDSKQDFPLIRAQGVMQETLACLQMLSRDLQLPFRKDAVEKILRDATRRGQKPDIKLCGNIANMLGLHAYGAQVPAELGTRLQTPALVNWGESFALVKQSSALGLELASPRDGEVMIKASDLKEQFPEGIDLLMVDRTINTPEQRFSFGWFWPALKRHRSVLLQVFVASFVVQLFGLANPLLIQVIIDKVISQRSLDTLQVLGIALIVVTVLGGVIGSLRTFLFTETTNRIDTRLGSEVIDHLLRLPLNYFDKRPVGELGTRVAELEKIRNFLTGQALSTILDAAFSVIYIIVMILYSWLLTLIALAVLPIQVLLTLIGSPLIRRQIRETSQRNAKTQSHLVEILTGIQTVKAQNVETVSRWKWQDLYNNYISKTFEKTLTTTALSETSKVLQQLSQLMVLWVGATLVLSGQLTLGQLIAFRIISGFVTQPLLRLSNIWQSIQELKVSFERLADIIDTSEESCDSDQAKIPLPTLIGNVRFEDVEFAFKEGSPTILNRVNLNIPAGTFVGIVGQSGSGKSTLMKLLPRLYEPNKGRIFVDDYDIKKVELYSLRRQIGIVPQDPLLFAGSVNENIALTNPDASSDEIVAAAKLADAHDFIMGLPLGYSTDVGERGSSLSGGQRQRLALARTLLSKPQLLILDEATSALDYETERRVCDNLKEACKERTVFFITHRLTTIRNADIIILMHQGVIEEVGTHDILMEQRGRYYALYRQQEAG